MCNIVKWEGIEFVKIIINLVKEKFDTAFLSDEVVDFLDCQYGGDCSHIN